MKPINRVPYLIYVLSFICLAEWTRLLELVVYEMV